MGKLALKGQSLRMKKLLKMLKGKQFGMQMKKAVLKLRGKQLVMQMKKAVKKLKLEMVK